MFDNQTLLFVTKDTRPRTTGNGCSVLTYSLINLLREIGFEVKLIVFSTKTTEYDQQMIQQLDNLRVEHKLISLPILKPSTFEKTRTAIFPKAIDYLIPDELLKQSINSLMKGNEPEYLVTYNWPPINVHGLFSNRVSKVACLVDLFDEVQVLNRSSKLKKHVAAKKGPVRRLLDRLRSRRKTPVFYNLLHDVDCIIEHSKQHAVKLREMGYKNVNYLPHPLPKQARIPPPSSEEVTILIPGSLKGVASRLGFEFFLNKLLPAVENLKPQIKRHYRFRIVGHGSPPNTIEQQLKKHPLCDLVGYVDEIEEEYRSADIILVNIPVPHGFRTRIAEAFSFGLCVIAHSANSVGMPEIIDNRNALIASDPSQLADKLVTLINDSNLRKRLGEQAHLDFNEQISFDSAKSKMVTILNHLNASAKS